MPELSYKNDNKQDERLNPYSDTARNIQSLENEAGQDPYASAGIDQLEAYANDPKNASSNRDYAKEREETANPMNYQAQASSKSTKRKVGFRARLNDKRVVFGSLIGFLGIGGGLLATLFAPASILVNLMENAMVQNDTTSPAMERRFMKVFTGMTGAQDPICKNTKKTIMKCKMGKISNKALRKLDKKGFTANFDSDTKRQGKLTGYPSKNPKSYTIDMGNGKPKKTVAAKDLPGFLAQKENRAIASKVLGYSGAFKLRFKAWSSTYLAKKFYNVFGIKKNGGLADGKNNSLKKTAAQAREKLKSKLPKFVVSGATASLDSRIKSKLGHAKKGGPLYLTAVASCIAPRVPRYFAAGVAAAQLKPLLPLFHDTVLSPASKLKGEAVGSGFNSGDMDTVGSVLTEKTPRESDKKLTSALDSPHLLALIGVNAAKPPVSKSFAPGYSVLTHPLTKKAAVTENKSASTCNKVLSPEAMYTAMAADGAASVAASATIVGGVIKFAASWAISAAVIKMTGALAKKVGEKIITDIAKSDRLPEAKGEELGDALGVSGAAFFASGGMARHLPSLNTDQAEAYAMIKQENEQFQQEMAIASLSPFDISSKYTFLGSMVFNLQTMALAQGSTAPTLSTAMASLSSLPNLMSSNASADQGISADYCGYAEAFNVQPNSDGSIPAVNMAGMPCTGLTPEQINFKSGEPAQLMEEAGWLDEDVDLADGADIQDMIESDYIKKDTPLRDYIEQCSDPSTGDYLSSGESCAAQCLKDCGNAVASKNYCQTFPEDERQECEDNIPKRSVKTVDNPRAVTAIPAFLIDYQVFQATNGEDDEPVLGESSGENGAGLDLTTASYNFCHEITHDNCPRGSAKVDSIAKIIKGSGKPMDIIGAQEVSQPTQKALIAKLGNYQSFPSAVDEHNGVAIFWNSDQYEQVSSGWIKNIHGNGGKPKNHPWVQLKNSETDQVVYYLSSHSPKSPYGTREHRQENTRKYLAWAKTVATGNNLVIVTGDFNSNGKNDGGKDSPYCIMTTGGVMQHALDRQKNPTNFSTPCPSAKGISIDQIYSSTNVQNLKATGYGRIKGGPSVTGSDHAVTQVTYSIPSDDSTTSAPGGTVDGDDYKTECKKYLRSGYYCPGQSYSYQCTAFVNFRLAKHGVIKPNGIVSGNGREVVGSLKKMGFKTGKTPQVNSVFSTSQGGGGAGHTGMVSKVNSDGSIVIEEYNYANAKAYGTRTLTKAQYASFTFAYVGGSYK